MARIARATESLPSPQVIRRRKDFERWRHEVAMEAANEAFNASAGRLKKLWAVRAERRHLR